MRKILLLILVFTSFALADETKTFEFSGSTDQAFNAALLAVQNNWSLRHASVKSGTIWFTRYGGRDRIDFDLGAVIDPGSEGHSNVTIVLLPAKKTPTAKDAESFANEFQRAMEKYRNAPLTDMVKSHGGLEVNDAYETITRGHPYQEVFDAAKVVAERRFESVSADPEQHSLTFKRVVTPTLEHPGGSQPLVCLISFTDQRHDDWRLRIRFRREDSGKVFLSSDTESVAKDFFDRVQDLLKLGVSSSKPASTGATCHFAPC